MADIKTLTFTDDSSQGKQKVYLCLHPDDFDKYFSKVCEDIFKANPGCAICYDIDTEGMYNRDDLLLMLSNMQLFVAVVTRRFLEEPSRVKALDIPFALGREGLALKKDDAPRFYHIPVLPVTYEKIDYRLFNSTELFQGMQYLKRDDKDETTLSFEALSGRSADQQ